MTRFASTAVVPRILLGLVTMVAPTMSVAVPITPASDGQSIELLASDGAAFDTFGWRVAVSGDTALVGAPQADIGDRPDEGAAYVFRREPTSGEWIEEAKLTVACDTVVVQICGFGTGVALVEDTALVGAPDADPNDNVSQGAAYVFVRDPASGEWTEEAKLVASDGAALDQLGIEVALADGIALVGAPFATVDGVPLRGAAYLFERDPVSGTWVQRAKFTNPEGDEFDELGAAVALSGQTALVGEPFTAVGENAIQGAVHVFERDAEGNWAPQARLVASDGAFADDFGAAVALSGDIALIGARGVDIGGNIEQGAAYVFTRDSVTGEWTERAKLTIADGASEDFFGSHVALSGDTALIGAPTAGEARGVAYVFEREPGSEAWSQTARLDPPAPEVGAGFGTVAIAGSRALIGAPHADVSGMPDQGAAHLFDLGGGTTFSATALTVDFSLAALDPDVDSVPAGSDANGVFEPGEVVEVAPVWRNDGAQPASLAGTATDFTGPPGASYKTIEDLADYGLIDAGETGSCTTTGVCYRLGVEGSRPATHWETSFEETLSDGTSKTWSLHIGDSFADVPRQSAFYTAIETLLHHGVTAGCAGAEYCPAGSNTRGEMAVLLLKASEGGGYVPPACVEGEERFADVPFDSPFCPWIEELASRGVTSGCGDGNYCPGDSVTRAPMAVFLLRALEGGSYTPPACKGVFSDVDCPSLFADWVEELARRGITGGCGVAPSVYCPAAPVTRGQMAAFFTKAFGLMLYGP